MPVVINEDGSVTVTGSEAQTIVDGLSQSVSTINTTQAISNNDIEQIITTEGPDTTQTTVDGVEIIIQTVSDSVIKTMYQVDHGILDGLDDDDHPQYVTEERGYNYYTPISHIQAGNPNPHNMMVSDLTASPWAARINPIDLQFILDNMQDDSIPSTRIQNVVAGKIAAGQISTIVSLSDTFVASQNGSVLNEDQTALINTPRVEMGYKYDLSVDRTFMLRQHNGYAANHPSYISNFNIDALGNVEMAGTLVVGLGSKGIDQFDDAGNLVTRDTQIFWGTESERTAYQNDPIQSPIIGDLWYQTPTNEPFRFNGVFWVSVKDTDLAVAQGAIDGKIKSYFQSEEPPITDSADNGDIWFDTDDDNKLYVYQHPVWGLMQDGTITTALQDAATAQATADKKIFTYVGPTSPTEIDGLGDLWYDTTNSLLYRVNVTPANFDAIFDSAQWDVISNAFNDTSYFLLNDSANFAGTADWSTVNDDDSNKPQDNADVTNIGGANYVIRGLSAPNDTVNGVLQAQNAEAAGNWEFTLPDSMAITSQMIFNLPKLETDTDYVLTFYASALTDTGTDMSVSLFDVGITQLVVVTDTPTKFEIPISSGDPGMAIAQLQFNKMTVSTNPTDPITVYDVKFEKGTQSTDWTPYNPLTDNADATKEALENSVTIGDGGLIFSSGGSIHSQDKDTFGNATPGIFLGWDASRSDYVFHLGDPTNFISWDGTSLVIGGTSGGGGGSATLTDANALNINTVWGDVAGTTNAPSDNADITDYAAITIEVQSAANAAQIASIAAAALDATAKANLAEVNANAWSDGELSAAEIVLIQDATDKADAAELAAINAAALDATAKANAAVVTADAAAAAQVALEVIRADAYADLEVTAAELRSIADATAKADAAQAAAILAAQGDATSKATAAQNAAEIYAAAQVALEVIRADAYADDEITLLEARAIADATSRADAAEAAAIAAAALDATAKAALAEAAAISSANASAALAETNAIAWADGEISIEEARAILDATTKANAAEANAIATQITAILALTKGLVSEKTAAEAGYPANANNTTMPNVNGSSESCHAAQTYAQAVALADGYGTRLPTLAEVMAKTVTGTGCSYDGTQIWTQTESAPGERYTVIGSGVAGSVPTSTPETSTSNVRFVADVDNTLAAANITAIQAAAAQSDLDRITAEAYADGIVTIEESRAIADAQAKADAVAWAQIAATANAPDNNADVTGSNTSNNTANVGSLTASEVVSDLTQALSDIVTAQATADGKVVTFYQDAQPTAEGDGDLWIDTNDGNKLYRWNLGTTTWVLIQDSSTAIADAASALAASDGKIVSFYQNAAPTATAIGDLWFDTNDNNEPYWWNDSSWVSISNPTLWANVGDPTGTKPADNADSTQDTLEAKITISTGGIDLIGGGQFYIDGNGGEIDIDGGTGSIQIAKPGGNATSDYVKLTSGDINFYDYYGGSHVLHKSLRKTTSGTVVDGGRINLGYFRTIPEVIISPKSLLSFDATYAAQDQTFLLDALSVEIATAADITAGAAAHDYMFTGSCKLAIGASTTTGTLPGAKSFLHTISDYSNGWKYTAVQYGDSVATNQALCKQVSFQINLRITTTEGWNEDWYAAAAIETLQGGTWVRGSWQSFIYSAIVTNPGIDVSVNRTITSNSGQTAITHYRFVYQSGNQNTHFFTVNLSQRSTNYFTPNTTPVLTLGAQTISLNGVANYLAVGG